MDFACAMFLHVNDNVQICIHVQKMARQDYIETQWMDDRL